MEFIDGTFAILEKIAHGIDLIGILIVLWGFALGLVGYLRAESANIFRGCTINAMRDVRLKLGSYILLGIEFMIASDLVNTVISRSPDDLIFVAALVVIRTAISYFLGKELEAVRRETEG